MATVDIASIQGWNNGNKSIWQKTAAKAQALWNIQSRSSVTANKILAAINRKLVTPVPTRWNSFFDAIDCLLKVLEDPIKLESINKILITHGKVI